MAEELSAAQPAIGDFASKLVELTDEVLCPNGTTLRGLTVSARPRPAESEPALGPRSRRRRGAPQRRG